VISAGVRHEPIQEHRRPSTANGTCGQSSASTSAITTGTARTSPSSNDRPARTARWPRGELAGALTGLPQLPGRPTIRGPYPPVPGTVSRGDAAGGAIGGAGAGDVHRDHPSAPGPGHAGVGGHADPDPRTLRAALNAAIRQGLIGENAAAKAELPRARRSSWWCGRRTGSNSDSGPRWRCGPQARPPSSWPPSTGIAYARPTI
jgi:hypothetical protein